MDVDVVTKLQMNKVFKEFSERYKLKNKDLSSDEESDLNEDFDPDCPGKTIQK